MYILSNINLCDTKYCYIILSYAKLYYVILNYIE